MPLFRTCFLSFSCDHPAFVVISCTLFRELGEVNLAVNLAGFHQLVVCAVSFERTISKNEDLVCLTDAGDSLGYEEGCRVFFEIVDGFAEFCIRCKVKRTRAVVQNQDFRFFYQRTRNRKTLFLSAGEVLSVLLRIKSS